MSKDIDQLPPATPPGSQPDAGGSGVPQGGTPGSGGSDGGKSIDQSKFVPAEDLNRLRSRMDRQLADANKRFDELNQQYKALMEWREKNETEGLSDEELAAYEAEKAQYEAQKQIAEARNRASQLEYEKNFIALQQYYLRKGAPQSILQIEDPAEMQEAFIEYLRDQAIKAQEELAKLKNGELAEPKDKQPPQVTTHKPAGGSLGKLSWSAIKVGSKEEAELLAALDSGKVKPEDIEA